MFTNEEIENLNIFDARNIANMIINIKFVRTMSHDFKHTPYFAETCKKLDDLVFCQTLPTLRSFIRSIQDNTLENDEMYNALTKIL